MFIYLRKIIIKFFSGNERSVRAKKNIILSFGSRFLGIIIGFLLVPITIGYLDNTRYGIWITLSSLIAWVDIMDFGLGGGLQNNLAEALAKNNKQLGQKLVSTAYFFIFNLTLLIILIFLIINNFIDWTKILNTDESFKTELSWLSIITFVSFTAQFVLRLIYTILIAIQKSGISNIAAVISSAISLLIIFFLKKFTNSSLVLAGLGLSISPVIVQLILSFYLFKFSFPNLKPKLKLIDISLLKNILKLGIKFFFIKISAIVLFQTSNFLISNFYSPADVTPYNIANKLFSSIYMIFSIIINPFQPAFTEAHVKNDVIWIKHIIRKLLSVWVIMLAFAIILLIFSPQIYSKWVGDDIKISFRLSSYVCIYYLLFSFGGIFNLFINGIGKLMLQIVCLGISTLLFFPLAYFLSFKFGYGIEGIILAMIIINFYSPIFAPIQYFLLISNRAKGLWNL